MPGNRPGNPQLEEIQRILSKAGREYKRRSGLSPADFARRLAAYNTRLEVIGLPIPELRSINQAGYSFCPTDLRQPGAGGKPVMRVWQAIWNDTENFEAKTLVLLYFETRLPHLDPKIHWPGLKRLAPDIENWDHSDRFSKIFAQMLEQAPDAVYPTLQSWNHSSKPWLRRQSVVSLLCFTNLRKVYPPVRKILPLIKNLLEDPDMYVQKGVGWTLRETGRAYPAETLKFLHQHISRLSSIAFSAATEKLSKSEKQKLKDLRR